MFTSIIAVCLLLVASISGQNCPTSGPNLKACAKCDLNMPTHLTELTMLHSNLKFPSIHPSFGMQITPGWTSDCCLQKSYICQATGNSTQATILFNEELVPDVSLGVNFECADCFDKPTKTCSINLICDDSGVWTYTSPSHDVVMSNIETIGCSDYAAPT